MTFFLSHQNKILRVLNLWQKNGVFEMNILQPLMDMAASVTTSSPTLGGSKSTNDVITEFLK